jgi:hypothetical protein
MSNSNRNRSGDPKTQSKNLIYVKCALLALLIFLIFSGVPTIFTHGFFTYLKIYLSICLFLVWLIEPKIRIADKIANYLVPRLTKLSLIVLIIGFLLHISLLKMIGYNWHYESAITWNLAFILLYSLFSTQIPNKFTAFNLTVQALWFAGINYEIFYLAFSDYSFLNIIFPFYIKPQLLSGIFLVVMLYRLDYRLSFKFLLAYAISIIFAFTFGIAYFCNAHWQWVDWARLATAIVFVASPILLKNNKLKKIDLAKTIRQMVWKEWAKVSS